MKAQLLISVAALSLAACGQNTSPPASNVASPGASELILSCANFAGVTPTTLTERFGAENVTTQTLPGPEGESYEATLVFANDPARRLEIGWNEDKSAIASATVNVSTDWVTTDGGANDGKTGIDSYAYQTYIHEIGHALGLGHQGP